MPLVGTTRAVISVVLALVLLSVATFTSNADARNMQSADDAAAADDEVEQMSAEDAAPGRPGGPKPIRLRGRTIEPGPDNEFSVPEAAPARAGEVRGAENAVRRVIVQFDDLLTADDRATVESLGGEIVGYVPEDSLMVRAEPRVVAAIRRLDQVTWVGRLEAEDKIAASPTDAAGLYEIHVEADATAADIDSAIQAAGATALSEVASDIDDRVVLVSANGGQLRDIAASASVVTIEDYGIIESRNEAGAGVITGTSVVNSNGYDGSGQVIGVLDGGLGDGTRFGAHPDIPAARIKVIYDWPGPDEGCFDFDPNGSADEFQGHGTHVVGSALGAGRADGAGRGAAPGARLVMQTIEDPARITSLSVCAELNDGYYLRPINATVLSDMFTQAYGAGARIHNNSWGINQNLGQYTARASATDAFVNANPKMTIVFAAGNEGIDSAPLDGVVDRDSIGPPSTAKNAITVGASENVRSNYDCDLSSTLRGPRSQSYQTCAEQGGENTHAPAGVVWGNDYPVEPISSDRPVGNAEQMAVFSSRGPTDDGRIKPDVVAPGTWILSTRSSAATSVGWGLPADDEYQYNGGTSMAAPIVSGVAALLREYYVRNDGHHATAALVKATLINSAVDLLDENNDGADDNDFPIPNVHEGWGRVDAQAATDGTHVYKDRVNGLTTGQQVSYTYDSNGGAPFKATLVWSDAPGLPAVGPALVNNLDLIVTAPNGTVYRGNNFAGGWSQSGGSTDTVNNVENVFIASPQAGRWRVTIQAPNVPTGPQPFALVVDNPTGFQCQADEGVLTWSDANQARYWTYKSTDGGATFAWLGKTLGDTRLADPSPAPGTQYQVHYQGLPRINCTVTAEPTEATGFACQVDAGLLSWTDDAQPRYWIYRSVDNGGTYTWLGRTLGATSYQDPSPVIGARYQVHYLGLPRTECTVISEPTSSVAPFACQASNGVLTWTDHDQARYWTYRSTDGGATYVWLGKTEGSPAPTTITDPNWASTTLYQVHYAGAPRANCT